MRLLQSEPHDGPCQAFINPLLSSLTFAHSLLLLLLLSSSKEQRSHSLTLPSEENNLIRKNFLHRMLFRDIYLLVVCIVLLHLENFPSYVPLYLYVC